SHHRCRTAAARSARARSDAGMARSRAAARRTLHRPAIRASHRRHGKHRRQPGPERHRRSAARAARAALRRSLRQRARHRSADPHRRSERSDRCRGVRAMSGTVFLVGAGPGASDLLTVRAARLLGEAEVVFHDALIDEEVLQLASRAVKISVGKRCGRHSTAQRFINKRLADAARSHKVVVRLKGGDPMLFGRAHEEIAYLQAHGIRVAVVPGVTAALAASAELAISLTRRGAARSVALVTPRVGEGERESQWIRSVLAADTAAIYM